MSTARDLINGACDILGVLAAGETLSSEEANDGLKVLNKMLAQWNTQGLAVLGALIESFSVSAASSYTLGTGGDLATTVPVKTTKAYVRIDSTDYPLKMIDEKRWAELSLKSTSSDVPKYIYIDKNHPLKTVRLWPELNQSATIILHNHRQLSTFALSDTVSLPQGYEEAIEYNLARRLSSRYGVSLSPDDMALAKEAFENIKRVNISNTEVAPDCLGMVGGGGVYNINSGSFD